MPERGAWRPQWVSLAEKFPATLSKSESPEVMPDGRTPEAYGIGLERPGYLYAATPSDGTVWNGIATVATPTYTPLTGTQYWRFANNRLWGWPTTGTRLYYGAYGYDSHYIIDGLGYVPCDFESSNITDVIPFGDKVAVFKADCLYIINNAGNPGDGFIAEYVAQSRGLPTASLAIGVDKTLYWVNTGGVFMTDGQQVVEVTEPIRDNLGAFASGQITSLRSDFQTRRVIGRTTSTQFIIVPGQQPSLFDYSTSGLRFTTRTMVADEGDPLLIDKVGFVYQYSAGNIATLDLDVKINDIWKTEPQFKIRPVNDNGRCEFRLQNALACRKFAIRITGMSGSLYISKIMVSVKQGGTTGYSHK